jgi:AcrR family transcriptional regulator
MKDSRQNILDATERLLQSEGLARLTTREIAREAGVAEGLIYHHFGSKASLILKVVERRMLPSNNAVRNLPLQVGLRTVWENLADTAMVVYYNHHETAPIACSTFADKQLREQLSKIVDEETPGPQNDIKGLAAYVAAEQRLGRVAKTVDPQVAANCVWKIVVQTATEDFLTGRTKDEAYIREEIRQDLQFLMSGMEPRTSAAKKAIRKKYKDTP